MNTFRDRLLRFPLWLLALLLLIGCAQEAPATATVTAIGDLSIATASATAPLATEPPAPTATSRPTITPEPTPVIPQITAEDQSLGEDGQLVFQATGGDQAGWLAVFADSAGEPGTLLGYAAVPADSFADVTVSIDPWGATPTLHARLHTDQGNSDEFEFPGSDTPMEVSREEVEQSFLVDINLPVPTIEVTDQAIAPDGLVRVDNVSALSPGWLVIHTFADSVVGPAIGQVPVDEGDNNDLVFPIRWREATTELAAVLHEDQERPGGFVPAVDLPVLAGGEAVIATFEAELPPDIFAFDQPVVDGKLALERVITGAPGWLVVYNDDGGQPGSIIGSGRLLAGVNEFIEVEVVESAVTPALYLAIHDETDNPAELNFPIADPPATYDEQAVPPTLLVTTPGNYLITRDQAVGEENEVVVPLVVTDLNTWLVIYSTDEAGQPDEILGRTWLPAGVNRDSRVAVPASAIGQSLAAVLHLDTREERQFEFPDGDDVPLQRNRQIIVSPFELYEGSEGTTLSP